MNFYVKVLKMDTPTDFNLISSPLEGTNLIEASAGTGKTYAITGLFIRLILEKNLSVNEILVVTFTEAATGELKDRIRTRLREAIEAFSLGEDKDGFMTSMVLKIEDRAGALKRLKGAIRTFDEAGIYTIHGFCRKMLHEYAFESGSLFDTELVTEQESLKKEIVEDFWRLHFYRESPLFVHYAVHNKANPENFLSLFRGKVGGLEMKVIPELENPNTAVEEKQFKEAFDELCGAWPSARETIEQILENHAGLNRNIYRKKSVPGWIQDMDDFIASGGNSPVLFKGFVKFCPDELERAAKKNHRTPDHPFFHICATFRERCEDLTKAFEQRFLSLKIKLYQYLQGELELRKKGKNIQFFDDLLLKLYNALEGKGGKDLSQGIGSKFKAALIDEFQDTDPIQYAIFKTIFNVDQSVLFLIGDPKQAIYGFRGADIFAYMDASVQAKTRYTLKENWRSEPGLISAVNTVFENVESPFVYKEIPFHPVIPAAEKKDHEFLCFNDGPSGSPLQLWYLDAGKITGTPKALSKSFARDMIAKAVAAEISRLLSQGKAGTLKLGERNLRDSDIAVLVRQNSEAHIMQQALSELDIPGVLYTTDDLFASFEAQEMERVLRGIAQPDKESSLRASLATDMIGVRGEQIHHLIEDERQWEQWLVRFRAYHSMWQTHGFMRMFKSVVLEEKVLSCLMAFPDGERRCTNVLHLSEVLHQVSVEKKLGMAGLVKWLSEKRNPDSMGAEEHQLRLESDENAVRLVTIHRSKGLEYPIVFCPFVWGNSRSRNSQGPFMFHDEADNMRLTLDLGSDALERNRMISEKETLAENLRLFYVALTRAKNRCYLAWGRFNQADTSAPAYLFHPPGSDAGDNIVDATGIRFKSLSDQELYSDLKAVCDKARGCIRLSEMPNEAGRKYTSAASETGNLEFHLFRGRIDPQFRVTSFSSMVSGRHESAELFDQGVESGFDELMDPDEITGIFSFPKGAKPGTFMHDILEHLNFTEKDESHMKELVETKLLEYGFDSLWNESICHMLQNVMAVPLETGQEAFTLSHIPDQARLNELGFYFPLKFITPKKLKRLFKGVTIGEQFSDIPEHVEKLTFSPVSGFMKGYMDLVFQYQDKFYLVDWKSNFLGNHVTDYGSEALALAMKEDFYILQYHIYTVALHQYLNVRLGDYNYEEHFGGVYYIFLRGVDPDTGPQYGVYRDRPSVELIEILCEELIDLKIRG